MATPSRRLGGKPRAEHEMFERIRIMAIGRAVLLVSHRFSSVRSAVNNGIFVLRGGQLVEQGRHEKLLARGHAPPTSRYGRR